MIRRRRPQRRIAFSFDSFLDVVANVVGIILRLILVTWVGASAYKATRPAAPAPVAAPAPEAATAPAEPAPLPEPRDPLSAELERQRAELERAQAGLLAEVRRWEGARQEGAAAAHALAAVAGRREKAEAERVTLDRKAGDEGQSLRGLALSMEELRARGKRVAQEIEALRRAP